MEVQPHAPGEKEKNKNGYGVIPTQDLSLEGFVSFEKMTVEGEQYTKDEEKQK